MPRGIHPVAVAEKIQAGEPVYLLDVRQQWENDFCHLKESVLIPLGELPEHIADVQPPENATIVVYCHHGVRSLSGAAILEANGFQNVYSMMGGIDAWSELVDPKVPKY